MIPASLPDLKVEVSGNTCCSNNRSKNVVYDPKKNQFRIQSTNFLCCVFGSKREVDERTVEIFCRCLTTKFDFQETESIRKDVMEKGLTKDQFQKIVEVVSSRVQSQNSSIFEQEVLSPRIPPSQMNLSPVIEIQSPGAGGTQRINDRLKRRHLTPLDIQLSVKIHMTHEESGRSVDREETLTPAFVVSALRGTPGGQRFHSNAINKVVRLVINELENSGSKDVYEEAEIINLVGQKGGEVLDELGDRSDCSTPFDENELRSDSPHVLQQENEVQEEQVAELFNIHNDIRTDQQNFSDSMIGDLPNLSSTNSGLNVQGVKLERRPSNKLSLAIGGANRRGRGMDYKEEDSPQYTRTLSSSSYDCSPGGHSARRLNLDGSLSRGGSPKSGRKKRSIKTKELVPSARTHMSRGSGQVQNQSDATHLMIGASYGATPLSLPPNGLTPARSFGAPERELETLKPTRVPEVVSEVTQDVPLEADQHLRSQQTKIPLSSASGQITEDSTTLKSLPTVTFF